MYYLKLVKGKSYLGIVCATEDKPIVNVAEKEKADFLAKTGFFELVENFDKEIPDPVLSSDVDTKEEEESLFMDEMDVSEENGNSEVMELQQKTKTELIDYANTKGIDVTGCKTKDDIFSRIVEALANADKVRESIRV